MQYIILVLKISLVMQTWKGKSVFISTANTRKIISWLSEDDVFWNYDKTCTLMQGLTIIYSLF